ncbi:MAG TPA: phosphoribosyltransferase [Candidatus Bathyarchaeota archaeon]|nr:MAG: phosphoribosyltransferase [Candidatus Bathyarchaeota archaeon B24-2]HDN62446.1 phosphoribosyltransferase [Candidatus Bathyarchaeota archaeon]
MFSDRKEAGEILAEKLEKLRLENPVVLAIPRGGVVVGYEVARKLKAPLDVIVPRKLGAPGNPELAIGAVAEDGTIILDSSLIDYLEVDEEYIKKEKERQVKEIKRRLNVYRGRFSRLEIERRDVVIVDDGIATGATIRAAIASVRKRKPASLTLAVPVAPPSTIEKLREEVDRIVCVSTPEPFFAIGRFYKDFRQTTDEEVIRLLEKNRREVAKT